MNARVIALGHPFRGDDGAALEVARRLPAGLADVILAGRPGPGLLDLLDAGVPTVLLDCVRSGRPAGTIVKLRLAELPSAAIRERRASSHGLGPADALGLMEALGRPLPRGFFVGCEGVAFGAGPALSPAVEAAMDDWVAAIRVAVEESCTNTASSIDS